MKNSSTAKKTALASLLSALCFLMLFAGSIITVMDLSAAALASLIVVVATIEIGSFYPYLIWLVTSILGLLLLPDKFGSLVFLCFSGYYPMLKSALERLMPGVSWVLKLICFNIALSAILALAKFVFLIDDTSLTFSIVVYAVCNVTFLLFDIALSKLLCFYFVKIRTRIFKNR